MSPTTLVPRVRHRLRITGVVQGVGFRPFVYGLALRRGLNGFVGNDNLGVFVEVEGALDQLDQFREAIRVEAPPLARIETVTVESQPARGDSGFCIVESQIQPNALTLVSPDVALCPACRAELFDPTNRRYHYPFINCTHCGPRFTLIRDLPYDRPLTTMAGFVMCPDCAAEYHDPLDRRFHAQPTACPVCGPNLWVDGLSDVEAGGADARPTSLHVAQTVLDSGAILALKGIGGFHLACDATSDQAVRRLRERKGRGDKPFAIMVADLDQARAIAHVDEHEAALLGGSVRPIVLLRKRTGGLPSSVSADVAPGNPLIGVMLPYSPLHELLLDGRGPLVMTSGNLSDEPIVIDNAEARERLGDIADAFLMHDRGIHTRCDDSVVRVWRGAELPIRRSRGYAPFPVHLPRSVLPLLAVGGELKATFCLARDSHAFMSAHIGDLGNLETLEAFAAAVDHLQRLFRIKPERLACDRHPGYLGTRWAEQRAAETGVPVIHVQHHHAHIAAVMAENAWSPEAGPVIGFSFDGTGYGEAEGRGIGGSAATPAIWGGEVLLTTYARAERVAYLAEVPLAGGDAAIKNPYRVALAHLRAAGIDWAEDLAPVRAATPTELGVLARQFEIGFHTVPTSSMGRLFDAIASLLDVRQRVTYEGQAAIELEALAGGDNGRSALDDDRPRYAFELTEQGAFSAAPVVAAIVSDLRRGAGRHAIAAHFHAALADVIVRSAERVRRETGVSTVALSGGVFQNVTLLEAAYRGLIERGFNLLVHRQVPPNDGGLALGQVMVAAAQR